VDALELYQHRARFTQATALYLGLFAASGAALAVELFWLRVGTVAWWILLFLSVLWMAMSLYLVVFNLYYKRRALGLAHETRLAPGDVVYSDAKGRSPMLASKVLPLRGRPDYVVERDGRPIPVEVKTGKTPTAPYDSHVLQLAAYCYLVGETSGKRPPYGLLSYPERTFEVPYTDHLEDRLLKTLLRIQLAQRTGEVHRDHDNPRRCAGCSRRNQCPERL
jgi:CRISPR-associated exonuclease Cas4